MGNLFPFRNSSHNLKANPFWFHSLRNDKLGFIFFDKLLTAKCNGFFYLGILVELLSILGDNFFSDTFGNYNFLIVIKMSETKSIKMSQDLSDIVNLEDFGVPI